MGAPTLTCSYGGHVDYRLHVDFQKLGLWPGGFLTLFAESQYGNSVNQKAGALIPVNTAAVFPELDESSTRLLSVVLTQFLAPWVGVYLGKLDITQGDANEFAHDYRTQFMNLGLQYNLVPFRTIPYAPLGAGITLIPFDRRSSPRGCRTRTARSRRAASRTSSRMASP
jgi:hypothetical protein